jgi:D-amino-acid dehydrogenase
MRSDAIVLGAGMVGVSAAWHLLRRGKTVTLIDRREPGEETSYGNAGMVERDGFLPMSFPQTVGELLKYAGNSRPQLHYHPGFLPSLTGYLYQMRDGSRPDRRPGYAAAMAPLMRRTIEEHKLLAEAAGAMGYFRDSGGLRLYRTAAGHEAGKAVRDLADEHGFAYRVLSPEEVSAIEPSLLPNFHSAIFWPDAMSASNPGAVTKAYAGAFVREGGRFAKGDGRSLSRVGGLWQVETSEGLAQAPVAVVAMGPWTVDAMRPLGYRFPFGVIRGYHQHYRPVGNAALARTVIDLENGFAMAPMEQGIRLTSGYEFAARDAPATPVQIGRILPLARELFPVGEAVAAEPWMGRRPCLPDSLPLIGPAPRHEGLYIDTGHSHLGFTLGPVSGRLIAEMIVGGPTVADPAPFSAARFPRA